MGQNEARLEELVGTEEALAISAVDPVSVPEPEQAPPAWARALLTAVDALNERLAVVESLAARRSVPDPVPPQPDPMTPEDAQVALREKMWGRYANGLQGAREETAAVVPTAPRAVACRTCGRKPHGPSNYCLECQLQQARDNRAAEEQSAALAASITRGPRAPVGDVNMETVELMSDFPG